MQQNPSQSWQLRTELEFSPQQHQGKSFVVVKDPVTTRYFRFTETQAAILELLRSPIDAPTLAARASEKLGGTLPLATVEGFIKSLEDKWLLDTPAIQEKLVNVKGHKLEDGNFLYWKLASLNAEKVFNWLQPRTRWAFTAGFQVFAAIMILTGLVLNYINIDKLSGSIQGLFNLHGLFFLWIVIFSVSTLHECAHGLTCSHFGGKVKELGFMLIYFNPAMYCDVSDSWMFTNKRHRILVTFAGGYFEVFLWSVATLTWSITDVDSSLNHLALIVTATSAFKIFFNMNPLIKLDGYYLLSDWLDIPNLRQKASAYMGNQIKRLWNAEVQIQPVSKREQNIFIVYGILSALYIYWLLGNIIIWFGNYMVTHYQGWGFVAFTATLGLFFKKPIKKIITPLVSTSNASTERRNFFTPRKIKFTLVVAAIVALLLLVKTDLKVSGSFIIMPRHNADVRAEVEGIIEQIYVNEGDRVQQSVRY